MRILIIRHGDPDYANDSVTERGKKEVAALTEYLLKQKIDYAYVSPLGRAQITARDYIKESGVPCETVEFLREFGHAVVLPDKGMQGIPWDLMPRYYESDPRLLDRNAWFLNEPMANGNLKQHYDEVCRQFDLLLEKHGYKREGLNYKVVSPNTDTLAFFCHYGIEATLLSHICGCAPHVLWQNFVVLPTGVTTLYTEEREKGTACLRCCGFGDVSHLYAKGIKPSPAGRFCETYKEDERDVDPEYQVSVEERVVKKK